MSTTLGAVGAKGDLMVDVSKLIANTCTRIHTQHEG